MGFILSKSGEIVGTTGGGIFPSEQQKRTARLGPSGSGGSGGSGRGSAFGREWDYSVPATPAMQEIGLRKVKLYAPKNIQDLERRRNTAMLNWDGMSERAKQEMQESVDDAVSEFGVGSLADRNRARILEDDPNSEGRRGFQIERYPQFDVRGWRFDSSAHYGSIGGAGGGVAPRFEPRTDIELLTERDSKGDWEPMGRETQHHDSWSNNVQPFFTDDGKTLGLMWTHPRFPEGLDAKKVVDDFMAEGLNEGHVLEGIIGESSRLAKEANWKEGAAYRDENYAKARKEDTVPSASEGPLSPAMKAKKTIRIRSAEEEERRLMEEPLKKGKK